MIPEVISEGLKKESRLLVAPISSDSWALDCERRILFNQSSRITLTATEALILKNFVVSEQRVQSKAEILSGMQKDPGNYTGLVMCMSRLQAKFRKASGGAGLIRAVRNRGYCLIKKVDLA